MRVGLDGHHPAHDANTGQKSISSNDVCRQISNGSPEVRKSVKGDLQKSRAAQFPPQGHASGDSLKLVSGGSSAQGFMKGSAQGQVNQDNSTNGGYRGSMAKSPQEDSVLLGILGTLWSERVCPKEDNGVPQVREVVIRSKGGPTTGYTMVVPLKITGKTLDGVVDMGADVSVINSKFIDVAQFEAEPVALKGLEPDRVISGHFIKDVAINLGGRMYCWDLYVASHQ